MNTETVKELLEMVDSAKNLGDMNLANCYFMIAFAQVIENGNKEVEIVLETGDPDGMSIHESYYDLLWLIPTGGGKGACIPLPMLNRYGLSLSMKRIAKVVERTEHNRQTKPDEGGHKNKCLWNILLLTFTNRQIENSTYYLERPVELNEITRAKRIENGIEEPVQVQKKEFTGKSIFVSFSDRVAIDFDFEMMDESIYETD